MAKSKIETVKVRVLKMGDGKISTGEHVSGEGDKHFAFGDTPELEKTVAMALEERGFVEIQP